MAPKPTGHLLKLLRNLMKDKSRVQAYIVPSGDEHQVSELVIRSVSCDLQEKIFE